MSSRFIPSLILSCILSLAFGVMWGYQQKQTNTKQYRLERKLKVVSVEGYFARSWFKQTAKASEIDAVLMTYPDFATLVRALDSGLNVDLAIIPDNYLETLMSHGLLTEVQSDSARNKIPLSVDFKNIPSVIESPFFLPLSWSISGFIHLEKKREDPTSWQSILNLKPPLIQVATTQETWLWTAIRNNWVDANWLYDSSMHSQLYQNMKKWSGVFNYSSPWVTATVQDPKNWTFGSNGLAARLKAKSFAIPKEGSPLEIYGVVRMKNSKNERRARRWLSEIYQSRHYLALLEQNATASVISHQTVDSKLHRWQRSAYLREIPFLQLHIGENYQSTEAWNKVLSRDKQIEVRAPAQVN